MRSLGRRVFVFCELALVQDGAHFSLFGRKFLLDLHMFVGVMTCGAVAWLTLFAAMLFQAPNPPAALAAVVEPAKQRPGVNLQSVAQLDAYAHLCVAPTLPELVHASVSARTMHWPIAVVVTRASLRQQLTEAHSHVCAPIEVLEAAFPGVQWTPSKGAVSVVTTADDGRSHFELPAPRRRYIGAILSRVTDRVAALVAIREAHPQAVPGLGLTWRCWMRALVRCVCGTRKPHLPSWAHLAIYERSSAAVDAVACTEQLECALATALRSAGGELLICDTEQFLQLSRDEVISTPSMVLPRRGSRLNVTVPLRAPRTIIGPPDSCAAMFTLRGRITEDGLPKISYVYDTDQKRKVAAQAVAWAVRDASNYELRSYSYPTMNDAVKAVCMRVLGFPVTVRDVAFAEAIGDVEPVDPLKYD